MGPLSIIVAAGLLLGLASSLQNPNVFGTALANVKFVNDFISLVNSLAFPRKWLSVFCDVLWRRRCLSVCCAGNVKRR